MRQLERLVQQPAVDDQIERIVGRAAPGRRRACRPSARFGVGRAPRRRVASRRVARRPARARAPRSRPWPSTNATLPRLARRELDVDLQRGARIEAGADATRQALAEAARPAARSVRLRPMNSARSPCTTRARLGGAQERDAVARTRCCRGCAREARPLAASTLGDDEPALAGARRAEAPLDVAEHAERRVRRRRVGERQHRQLDRIVRRDEDRQLLLQTRRSAC